MRDSNIDRSIGKEMPVALSYSLTVQVGQSTRPTQQSIFKNPYRGPLWVDEIVFTVSNPDDDLVNSQIPSAGLVGMRMKIDNRYLIEEFVPLWLLAPKIDISEQVTDNGFTVPSPYMNTFFWRLAKPMWLEELEDLSYEFNFNSAATQFGFPQSSTATVQITVHGRATLVENRPKERYVPFNVVWQPDMFTSAIDVETYVFSPDNALRNGRNVPVMVTRLFGDFLAAPPLSVDQSQAQGANTTVLLQARISHSLGYYFVKDLVPLYEMFLNSHREFGVKFALRPKEFLTVELQTRAINPITYSYTDEGGPATFTVPAIQYYGGFALQGYSVEPLK